MFYVCVFFFFFFFQAEDGIRDVAVTGVQTCALPILFPFYFMLITSLKSNAELYNLKSIPFLVQTGVIADHYQYLFQRTEFLTWMKNSLIISVVATSASLAIAILAGYSLARLRYRGVASFGTAVF